MDVDLSLIESIVEAGTAVNEFACICLLAAADTFHVVFPLFLLILVVNLLGRRWLAAWARHLLWTLVLVRLILPTSVASPLSVQCLWSLIDFAASIGAEKEPFSLLDGRGSSLMEASAPVSSNIGSWTTPSKLAFDSFPPQLLAAMSPVIVMGTLVFAGVYLLALFRLFGWMRYGRSSSDSLRVGVELDAQQRFGIVSHVQLRTVHQSPSSMAFDWFRPTILVPETFDALTPSQQQLMVWHEAARLRRGDSATSVLLAVVRMVHWWNPLFWWVQYCWTAEREVACDALVVGQLEATHVKDYARLLEQVHQISAIRSRLLVDDAPGFVSLLQWNCLLPGRLRALPKARRAEGRFSYWFSWCVVSLMAVVGLTDVAKRPLHETPIRLPTGTTWHDPIVNEPSLKMETRNHDISVWFAAARKDFSGWPAEKILDDIRVTISNSLRMTAPSPELFLNEFNHYEWPSGYRCDLEDLQLIVHGTPRQHERITSLILDRCTHRDRQIILEVQVISTLFELSQLLSKTGGKVFNSKFTTGNDQPRIPDSIGDVAALRFEHSARTTAQVFVRTLTRAEAKHLLSETQSHPKTNVLFAPKVTLFNGQSGSFSSGTQRPFVIGLKSNGPEYEATAMNINEGESIQMFAFIENEKISLHARVQISVISDVQKRFLRNESHEHSFQAPIVQESFIDVTAALASEETLLVVPLHRNDRGQLSFCLITPRIIFE